MKRLIMAGNGPPGQDALQLRSSRAAGRNGRRWERGKPSETAGRKAIGTKAGHAVCHTPEDASGRGRVRAAMSAWPLIIKGKPPETAGRKARGLKQAPWTWATARAKAARSLIIISKPLEMTGRKAMGAKVLEVLLNNAMPARPPDTLHPIDSFLAKKGMRE